MGAYSLHYYTLPSGSFADEEQGPGAHVQRSRLDHHAASTRSRIDEMISKHSAIMDKYDPAEEGRAVRG